MSGKNLLIIYFSATGNTLKITREIGKKFRERNFNVTLADAEKISDVNQLLNNRQLVGIAFPCYGFSYPEKVLYPIISTLNPEGIQGAFILSTFCIGAGMSMKKVEKELENKGFNTIYRDGFKCPSAGFYAISSSKNKGLKSRLLNRVKRFECKLDTKIENYVRKVIELWDNQSLVGKKRKAITPMDKILYMFAHWNEHRIFTDFKIDSSRCINCRKCVGACPSGNIKNNSGTVQFINTKECLMCMRCISFCPVDAVSLGKQTVGGLRYSQDVSRELFVKSLN